MNKQKKGLPIWQKVKFNKQRKVNLAKSFQAVVFIEKIKETKQIIWKIFKRIFWNDKKIAFFLETGLLFIIISGLLLFYKIRPSDSEVILHYNSYFGIDVISFNLKEFYFQVFLVPLAVFFVWLLNLALIFYLLFFQEKQQGSENWKKRGELFFNKELIENFSSKDLFLFSLLARFLAGSCFIIGVAVFVYVLAIIFIN